jgi:hypothetical protein
MHLDTFPTKNNAAKNAEDTRRYAKMTARDHLRDKAAELRRTARVVSDDDIARALIELAEHYEAWPTPRPKRWRNSARVKPPPVRPAKISVRRTTNKAN